MKKLIMLSCAIAVAGCSASISRMSMGDCDVVLYGLDGKPIQSWVSSGRVLSEDNSDGWYFTDKATGKVVIIAGGAVVVTPK